MSHICARQSPVNSTLFCFWARRLERAVMEVLKEAPTSVKTPDIGGSGTTASFVKAIKAEL